MPASDVLHVIFGNGAVGRAIAEQLVAEGGTVRIVSRSAREAPEGAEAVRADATDPEGATAAARGAHVVYQTAAPAYTRWEQDFPALQRGVLEAAARAGATLVAADNLYAYGPVDGPITEDLPAAATTRKGQVRGRLAAELLEAHAEGRVRATIGRASDFFGPGAGAQSIVGERVFRPAMAGRRVSVLGDPDAPHTYTYVHDFARGLITLGRHEEALGRAWHVPSAPTLTTRAFVERIFAAAGHEPRIGAVPSWVLRGAALVNAPMREVAEMLPQVQRPYVVSHARFEAAFGAHPTPHDEAIRATIASLQAP